MDFTKFKDKALWLKDKALEVGENAVNYGASKIADSKLTLKSTQELEAFVATSKTSEGKDSKSGEKKEFTRRVIIIFADPKWDFFKDLIYLLPVLSTKAFSQNISLRVADLRMKWLTKATYKIKDSPSLVVIENTKVVKVIEWEEKIQKVVKSLDLDINKVIQEL